MMKNNGQQQTGSTQGSTNNSTGGLGAMGGFPGMGSLGGFGGYNPMGQSFVPPNFQPQQPQNSNQSSTNQQQPNQYMGNPFGMGMNPYMMGFGNPFMGMQGMQQQQPQKQSQQQAQQPVSIQEKYKDQLKELQQMGFKDREQNLKALIESKGDVDGALERLVQD